MTWHYRAFKIISKKKGVSPYFCVKEYFRNCGDAGILWTNDPIKPIADSKKELINVLEMMLKDIKHYKTKVERK